jgi:tRNA-Thr(GGU) m(6)t(6)A37 methyltransferase TsaA
MNTPNNTWQEPVTILPIGVVVSDLKDFSQVANYQENSLILIREELAEGLLGLEHFSHIHVVYHQHRRKEWQKFVKWGESDERILKRPVVGEPVCQGIYTSRSPARPSGIGSCIVELLRREGHRLYVRGLDAFDGTPVLDIKIYIPRYDCFPLADAPLHWCNKHSPVTTSRLLHWDTMNVGLTLGLRAGQRAMGALGAVRNDPTTAEVRGGNFFAQGVEGVTGCSLLRGSMSLTESSEAIGAWSVRLRSEDREVVVRLHDRLYSGADEVLSVPDEILFSAVETGALQTR